MTTRKMITRAIAIAAIGASVAFDLVPANAAPLNVATVAENVAASNIFEQVRMRRGARGNVGAGVVLGMFGALAGAAASQNRYYDSPAYYGGYPYDGGYQGNGYYDGYNNYSYDPGSAIVLDTMGAVAEGPVYYSHRTSRGGRCWIATDTDRNYGYWGRCYR